MFITKLHKQTLLEKEIDCVLEIMSHVPPDAPEYSKIANNLDKLCKVQNESKKNRISKDVIAIIIGNILYILVVMGYERGNIITTRALQWIVKWRA
jgi:hypothetical protein